MLQSLKKILFHHPLLSARWKIAVLAIGIIGLLDSGYLTYGHYGNQGLACPAVKEVNSCEIVATSSYSTILGVPLSLLGLGFYILIIVIGLVSFKEKYQFVLNFIIPLALVAWIFSFRLTYLQMFVIKSFCYYCLLSALLSTILLVIGIIMVKKIEITS